MSIFAKFVGWLIDREMDIVHLISVLLPWAVPSIPAWLIYDHAIKQMEYTQTPAWIMGIVTEGLGLASMVTLFKFWNNNRKFSDEKMKMPLWIPVATYIFYLSVVLTINVILDWRAGIDWVKVLVVALFSLLSIPAGALLAVQTLYYEQTNEHARKLAERRNERTNARNERTSERTRSSQRTNERGTRSPRTNNNELRTAIYQMLDEYYTTNGKVAGVSDLARTIAKEKDGDEDSYGRYKGYVSEVRKDWWATKQ